MNDFCLSKRKPRTRHESILIETEQIFLLICKIIHRQEAQLSENYSNALKSRVLFSQSEEIVKSCFFLFSSKRPTCKSLPINVFIASRFLCLLPLLFFLHGSIKSLLAVIQRCAKVWRFRLGFVLLIFKFSPFRVFSMWPNLTTAHAPH